VRVRDGNFRPVESASRRRNIVTMEGALDGEGLCSQDGDRGLFEIRRGIDLTPSRSP